MRIFFPYNGKPQKSFDTVFKTHGFRTLFINNLINKLADENGEIPEKKLVSILMNEFDFTFKGLSDDDNKPVVDKDNQPAVDNQIAVGEPDVKQNKVVKKAEKLENFLDMTDDFDHD